jgi:hypothetical protein
MGCAPLTAHSFKTAATTLAIRSRWLRWRWFSSVPVGSFAKLSCITASRKTIEPKSSGIFSQDHSRFLKCARPSPGIDRPARQRRKTAVPKREYPEAQAAKAHGEKPGPAAREAAADRHSGIRPAIFEKRLTNRTRRHLVRSAMLLTPTILAPAPLNVKGTFGLLFGRVFC